MTRAFRASRLASLGDWANAGGSARTAAKNMGSKNNLEVRNRIASLNRHHGGHYQHQRPGFYP